MFQATKAHFFHTNHSCLLSTQALSQCLCSQECGMWHYKQHLDIAVGYQCLLAVTTDSNDWKTSSTLYKLKFVTQVITNDHGAIRANTKISSCWVHMQLVGRELNIQKVLVVQFSSCFLQSSRESSLQQPGKIPYPQPSVTSLCYNIY